MSYINKSLSTVSNNRIFSFLFFSKNTKAFVKKLLGKKNEVRFEHNSKWWKRGLALAGMSHRNFNLAGEEVVMFFLRPRKTMHGGAVRVIKHQCWLSMLGAFDITTQEGDLLHC